MKTWAEIVIATGYCNGTTRGQQPSYPAESGLMAVDVTGREPRPSKGDLYHIGEDTFSVLPSPELIITIKNAQDEVLEPVTYVDNLRQINISQGDTITVDADLQVDGVTAPITQEFVLPLVRVKDSAKGDAGSNVLDTRLIGVDMNNGVVSGKTLTFDGGFWLLTQAQINSRLPSILPIAGIVFDDLLIVVAE